MAQLGVVTLCSGIEAPIQSLEELPWHFNHLASCDIEPSVKKVVLSNFAPAIFIDDVAHAVEALDRLRLPQDAVDLLVAGFPCQPFSLQGSRGGFNDTGGRGFVVLHIARVIAQCMPKIVLLENVAGLAWGKMRETFDAILEILRGISTENVKYHVYWKILNSKYHHTPQSRPRLLEW